MTSWNGAEVYHCSLYEEVLEWTGIRHFYCRGKISETCALSLNSLITSIEVSTPYLYSSIPVEFFTGMRKVNSHWVFCLHLVMGRTRLRTTACRYFWWCVCVCLMEHYFLECCHWNSEGPQKDTIPLKG